MNDEIGGKSMMKLGGYMNDEIGRGGGLNEMMK